MAENWVTRSVRRVDDEHYSITKVRGYNREAAEYAKEHAIDLKAKYNPNAVIAVKGRGGEVIAQGKTIEEVVSMVGDFKEIQFPNSRKLMIGKVKDIVLAERRFSKHLDCLQRIEELRRAMNYRV